MGIGAGKDGARVALVTGASRGAGKGIALALGATGATVYVTGRTTNEGTNDEGLPGNVLATAEEVTARGGTGVAVPCDHSDDTQVAEVFRRITDEQGHLDILVNNAITLAREIPGHRGFWEMPLDTELSMLDVGLRSHYVAAWHAARMMAPRGSGLIVHISSPGATTNVPGMHGPAYGAGKAGGDKMMFDIASELRPHGVAAIALWPGLLRTERVMRNAERFGELEGVVFPTTESTEFCGRVIAAVADDPDVMSLSGRVHYAAELAERYGVTDVDGAVMPSYRPWLGPTTTFTDVAPTYRAYLDGGGTPIG